MSRTANCHGPCQEHTGAGGGKGVLEGKRRGGKGGKVF